MNIHLNNEGQECKTVPVRGRVLGGGGEGIERVRVVNKVSVLYMLV
jgi:hypothetical protein